MPTPLSVMSSSTPPLDKRLAGDVDLGVLGEENVGGVLDDLRDQVHHVVDGLADDHDAGLRR